ncbi:flavonol 3-O-glucosyltransferase F3GT2-like [Impatiens glandulifera]|uniref:flavonol 3-O-glucosyltransferase F3GT2-like n=1 Tax=Impatiens glandulifera TaxID=253017 RepID=UPI001FB0AF96|nr:flavonol 3-O-glucosyltransferase F3GT2-like [Impatiens glandulifera]
MESGQSPSAFHVAALAFPFGSHATPLLALVKRLSEAAPNVTFSFLSTAASNSTLFSGSSHSNIKPFNVSDGIKNGNAFPRDFMEGINMFLSASPGNFSEAIRAAEAETGIRVSCLITDAFLWFSSDLALEFGVDWIAYWTSAACSLSTHLQTDLIRTTVGNKCKGVEKELEHLEFIPGLAKVEIDDLQPEILSGDLNSPFSELLRKMGLKLPNATAVVVNSFEALEPTIIQDFKSKLKKSLCIGPASLATFSDESGSLSWLDSCAAASVVYIAFGSVAMLSPDEILALAEALEEAQFPFLWSIKDDAKRFLPNGFLERTKVKGKFVSWAPQVQVLKHASVGVFVMHGGWNSVCEGIIGGVPMICRPFFGDHSLNSRMVESVWEIGVKIPRGKFTKSEVSGALKRVLSSEKGDKMKVNVQRLKDEGLKAVEPHGSSTANFKTLVKIITNNDN